jgi:hypothetical protein
MGRKKKNMTKDNDKVLDRWFLRYMLGSRIELRVSPYDRVTNLPDSDIMLKDYEHWKYIENKILDIKNHTAEEINARYRFYSLKEKLFAIQKKDLTDWVKSICCPI